MFTEIYIEALADQVWELWYEGEISDSSVCLAWWLIARFMSIEAIGI